jgi:hypothetical protein
MINFLRTFCCLIILFACNIFIARSQDVTVNPALLDSLKKKETTTWEITSPSEVIKANAGIKATPDIEGEIKRPYPYWIIYIFLLLLGLITFVRVQYTKEFGEVFYVLRNNIITLQVYREAPSSGLRIAYFLLNINFVVTLAAWLLFLFKKAGSFRLYEDWQILSCLAGFVILAMLLRYIFLVFTSWLFEAGKDISYFNYTELQIFRCAGLILFPVIMLLYFSPQPFSNIFLLLSFIIAGTFFLYRYLRGFEIGRSYFMGNIFHFLVYICTLEIAPVLIGVKFVTNLLHQ